MATPSDHGTHVEMRVVTGSGTIIVNADHYFLINIPKSDNNTVFDPMNSYL